MNPFLQKRFRKNVKRYKVKPNPNQSESDLSHQMGSYATILRKGVKWFKKLGIQLILGVFVVKAWCVYRDVMKKKNHVRTYNENLAAYPLDMSDQKKSTRKLYYLIDRIEK